MALCTVTGAVYFPSGELARSRVFVFSQISKNISADEGGVIVPYDVWVKSSASGQIEVDLLDGAYTMMSGAYSAKAIVPDANTATLSEVLGYTA